MSVGDLIVPQQMGPAELRRRDERHVIIQEYMPTNLQDLFEGLQSRLGGTCFRDDALVGRYSHERALSQRTGRPPLVPGSLKPPQGGFVMLMIRPGQGYQNIDVEQLWHQ